MSKSSILHVIHAWGGGLEKWAHDYMLADNQHHSYILKPLGDIGKSALSFQLFEHTLNSQPTCSWRLEYPILATSLSHPEYKLIIDEIIYRFSIEKVIISSLIGHSLEILNLINIKKIIVLHDYYPFCPALNITFNTQCSECHLSHLQSCCTSNPLNTYFPFVKPYEWILLRNSYINTIVEECIPVVIPSKSVKNNLLTLEPLFNKVNFVEIPHGLDYSRYRSNLNCIDDTYEDSLNLNFRQDHKKKLKILILGRMNLSKGLLIFEQIYNELSQQNLISSIEFYLIGCGELINLKFSKRKSIQCLADYNICNLKKIVESISPDLSLLLSTVPETFSFTLSELFMLGIPVLATNLGSFADRIQSGFNGVILEPKSRQFTNLIIEILDNRKIIESIKANLSQVNHGSLESMISRYNQVFSRLPNSNNLERQPLGFEPKYNYISYSMFPGIFPHIQHTIIVNSPANHRSPLSSIKIFMLLKKVFPKTWEAFRYFSLNIGLLK